ncbi:sulfatase-like hydrolase/transferase [Pedobacter arcticus]|uniref:sulfatase-like hydrolase/transferase n=1 Tax=Pedobacter arcticus TaxID=752140 RepID=UPI0003044734|nr:sulfatase-like hydrolase/transferase [Pedobacter arcticus]
MGVFLDDLRKRKILENTIVFFFYDHGGFLPRGKAFPYDTGHHVPFIVYAPDKYKNLLHAKASPELNNYYLPQPVEALYDLEKNPWESNNLVENPKYKERLEELRDVNRNYIRDVKDLSF